MAITSKVKHCTEVQNMGGNKTEDRKLDDHKRYRTYWMIKQS